jgi:hypothetical protein
MLGWMAGLVAGAAHALGGPDHLAAVAPLAVDAPRGAWRVGLRWGSGHALAVGGLGTLALICRGRLNLDLLSGRGEALAGLALAALGLWGLRRALSRHAHVHEHEHDGSRHRHLHLHREGVDLQAEPGHARAPHRHRHAAFGFGVLHGIAGTAHFLGVLPVLALPGPTHAAAYVAAFALGTVVAMTICTAVVGSLAVTAGQGLRAWRWMLSSAATLSLGVGLLWLFTSF